MFQHKIIHNILALNSILYKMKKVASPSCPFCTSDSQNIRHLFITSPQASSFWYKFRSWYSTISNASLLISEPEVLFGITRPCTHHLTLNHLIILDKYFLYINTPNNTMFVFRDFISLVQDKNEIEKYCTEIDTVIAQAMMHMARCIMVVFECILARVLRLRDGYMASTECAMYL